MSKKRNRFEDGIEISPSNITGGGGTDLTREGEIDVDSSDSRLKVRVESATRTVVTENQTQTLTNKSISGSANTLTNVTATTNANLTGPITSVGNATSVASQTGTGSKFVMDTSPTLVTPNLGTPSAAVLTNATGTASGLTAGTVTTNANLTGAVTSVGNATSLGSFTSANLASALTDETGSGAAVFATSPTLVTPALGTPTALVGTNITGTAAGLTAGTVTTNANLTGDITSTGNATTYSGTVPLNKGGTGQNTKAAAFDALQPMTTGGDIIYGGASGTGTRLANGSAGFVLTSSGGTAAPTWAASASAPSSFLTISNLSFVASVSSNALTIALKDAAGADPSVSSTAIGFRSATATSGAFVSRSITAALSIVVSSGSTLGHANGVAKNIWLYAIDNAGTVELAVSSNQFDESYLYSTTAEGGAGAADSESILYSTTARTNVAIRLIGRLLSSQTTAGTYAAVPTNVSLINHQEQTVAANYMGSPPTGTLSGSYNITTYGTKVKDSHNAYSGGTYTVPISGVYSIGATARVSGTFVTGDLTRIAIFINGSVRYDTVYQVFGTSGGMFPLIAIYGIPLLVNDAVTIRILSTGTGLSYGTSGEDNSFSIVRTGNY